MAFLSRGGDADNKQHLLGQHQLQTGIFKSQTFQLLAENAMVMVHMWLHQISLEPLIIVLTCE